MKILFLLNGLTPYFNSVLNKINKYENFEIVVVAPEKNSSNIGKSVYLTNQGIEFKVHFKIELKRFYGKVFFENFWDVVERERPEIIVFIWPYILELVFNPLLLIELKRKKIKIAFKEIPFQLQLFSDAIRFKKFSVLDENLTSPIDSVFYRINNFFLALIRKYYYSFIEMNLHYIENGYEILKSYNVPKEKIFVTYNSPDTDKLLEAYDKVVNEPLLLPFNNHRLIHVGRLVKWKRIDLIIKAVSVLANEFDDIELIIIGDGPELNNLKALTKKLNLENRIIFVGPIYDTMLLGKYFHCSSVYILGGMGGLSINEAMAFGKPVICSVCDGTERHLLKDGFNGYYFLENNVDSLIEKIQLLLSSKDKLKSFGENSRQIIKNKINMHFVVENYIKAFNKIVQLN
jgi:glycosyltransferase involved in cell wall biosynthesis